MSNSYFSCTPGPPRTLKDSNFHSLGNAYGDRQSQPRQTPPLTQYDFSQHRNLVCDPRTREPPDQHDLKLDSNNRHSWLQIRRSRVSDFFKVKIFFPKFVCFFLKKFENFENFQFLKKLFHFLKFFRRTNQCPRVPRVRHEHTTICCYQRRHCCTSNIVSEGRRILVQI